jgi:hypothetical protein
MTANTQHRMRTLRICEELAIGYDSEGRAMQKRRGSPRTTLRAALMTTSMSSLKGPRSNSL